MRAGIFTVAVFLLSLAPAGRAGVITVVSGKVGTKEFGPKAVSGPGGSYAHVEAGPNMDPPAGKGQKANDQTKIGKTNTQTINQNLTEQIGSALKNTVGLKLMNKTDLEVGRSIFYKADESDDKVKEAKDNGGSTMLFARASLGGSPVASANQTVTVKKNDNGGEQFIGEGTANAALTQGGGRGEFAAAILNDPVVFQSDSTTVDPSVTFTLEHDLKLQVVAPGDLAEAVFEIGLNDTDVLDFALKVTYQTSSAQQTLVPLGGDPSSLGSSSIMDYLNAQVLPSLSWDENSRTLTAATDITLFQFSAPSDGTPETATFNIVGLASSPVPEPSSVGLFGLGNACLALCALTRKGKAKHRPR
jgi:hypothetical protein